MKTKSFLTLLALIVFGAAFAGPVQGRTDPAVPPPVQETTASIRPELAPPESMPVPVPIEVIGDVPPEEPEPLDLKSDILKLGEKVGNHALILFTTKHTDTVIDALRGILAKKGVPNNPDALAKFIAYNNINKEAFFKDVDTAKNFLAEAQVKLYTSWDAYLRKSWVKAHQDYVSAKAAWDKFEPAAKKVNDEIDRWVPVPSQGQGQSEAPKLGEIKTIEIKVEPTAAANFLPNPIVGIENQAQSEAQLESKEIHAALPSLPIISIAPVVSAAPIISAAPIAPAVQTQKAAAFSKTGVLKIEAKDSANADSASSVKAAKPTPDLRALKAAIKIKGTPSAEAKLPKGFIEKLIARLRNLFYQAQNSK